MKHINLLPKSEQKELRLLFFADDLIRFWIWIVVSLLIFAALTFLANEYLRSEVAETEGQIAQQRQILKSDDNEIVKQKVEELNYEVSTIKNLQINHYYWSDALVELVNLLPADIDLNLLSMDRVTGEVAIEGVAGSRDSVLKFWSDIHKSVYFKDIDFPLANLNRATEDPFRFSFFVKVEKVKNP
jgi:Tfp pilus assembly protein PilN